MRLSIFLSVLSLCPALISCKDNATSYSVGTGNGEIYGYVYLLDSIGGNDLVPRDFGNIQIAIENGPQITFTDIDGQFLLRGIPTSGKFNLIFTRTGFAESRDIDHEFKPGSSGSLLEYFNTKKMYQIRRLIPNLVLRAFGGTGDTVRPYLRAEFTSRLVDSVGSGQQYSGMVKMYFGKDASVSSQNPTSFQFATNLTDVDSHDGTSSVYIYRDSLLNNGFTSDSKIYVIAYYTGFYTQNEFYIDKATGKRVYTGFSPYHSEVRSFILP